MKDVRCLFCEFQRSANCLLPRTDTDKKQLQRLTAELESGVRKIVTSLFGRDPTNGQIGIKRGGRERERGREGRKRDRERVEVIYSYGFLSR